VADGCIRVCVSVGVEKDGGLYSDGKLVIAERGIYSRRKMTYRHRRIDG
jgi:hypothetical protein